MVSMATNYSCTLACMEFGFSHFVISSHIEFDFVIRISNVKRQKLFCTGTTNDSDWMLTTKKKQQKCERECSSETLKEVKAAVSTTEFLPFPFAI